MEPILSIVIPTKNRYFCLKNLIDKLMLWPENMFEVVVQDNSENNAEGLELAHKYSNDSRFKYFYNKRHLSVVENSELSIENSSGEYICFLGDDDGIIYHAVQVVKWMKRNNIDSLSCNRGSYCWADFRHRNRGKKRSLAGMLLYKYSNGSVEYIDTKKELVELLQNGALTMGKICRLYHGIVKRSVLNEVRDKTGSYFPGPVPDMSNAVALAFYCKKHVYLNFPLITAGASRVSMAGRGSQNKSHGKIENENFLPKDTADKWSKELPKYWAPQTIWPEGALQALRRTDNDEYIKHLNLSRIFAELLMEVPKLKEEVYAFIKKNYDSAKAKYILEQIPTYKKKFKLGQILYEVKVNAVFFDVYKLVGLTKIKSDTIDTALTILEEHANLFIKKSDSNFSKIFSTK